MASAGRLPIERHKTLSSRSGAGARLKFIGWRILKWSIVTVLALAALLFAAIEMWFLTGRSQPHVGWLGTVLAAVSIAALAFATAALARKIASEPLGVFIHRRATEGVHERANRELVTRSKLTPGSRELMQISQAMTQNEFERCAALIQTEFAKYPADPWLLTISASLHAQQKDLAAAEAIWDLLLAPEWTWSDDSRAAFLLHKLWCAAARDDFARSETGCMEFLNGLANVELKLFVADRLACVSIYQNMPAFYEGAVRIIRKALDLAPESLTLKGTLGGILVERGNHVEAEPLLRECYSESPHLHDCGIALYYLGVIEGDRGKLKLGKRMVQQAMSYYPERWLIENANAKLKAWEQASRLKS